MRRVYAYGKRQTAEIIWTNFTPVWELMYLSNIKKWKVKSPYFTSVVRNSHQYQANKLDADSAFIFPTLPPSPDRIVGTVTPHKFDKTFVK